MPLKLRLVTAIGSLLAASMIVGVILAGWHARLFLDDELSSGLAGARLTVEKTLEDLPGSDHPDRDLMKLRAIFDGNRHVVASLMNAHDEAIAESSPARPRTTTPPWFRHLFLPPISPITRAVPTGKVPSRVVNIRIASAPDADLAELWSEAVDLALVMLGFCGLFVAMVYLIVGRALRPLQPLGASLLRIGAGDYTVRVDETGPAELAAVAKGFNQMAGELAAAQARTEKLEAQLLTLQDEERAELARDLHDEIGPYLFAVNLDASMIERHSAAKGEPDLQNYVSTIKVAVAHMQRQVRDLLDRLRTTGFLDVGLRAALLDIVAFWEKRFPAIGFDVVVEGADKVQSEPLAEAIFYMVQEGVSNAIRHARPKWITVRVVSQTDGGLSVRIQNDGQLKNNAAHAQGYGLRGMRERIARCGGALIIQPDGAGDRWTLLAEIPAKNVTRNSRSMEPVG